MSLAQRRPAFSCSSPKGCIWVQHHTLDEGKGRDVVVVCSLNEITLNDYAIGFPGSGRWRKVFNSDVYDHWVNPIVAGNRSGVNANGPVLHGLPASAALTIPANGLLVFAELEEASAQ